MAALPFVKASACGNDFLIIDAVAWPGDIHPLTRAICDRHNGVGADGVEWIHPANDSEVRIKLVNADGSDAEISGNGTRCVAAWYCSQNPGTVVRIETDAGVKTCELISSDGNSFEFRAAMGQPAIGGETAIGLSYDEAKGIPVSMGNPHFVIFVDEFGPQWKDTASEIAVHRHFPHGTNVEFVRVLDAHKIDVLIWERGVGETLSSGTGSSASAVAAMQSGRAQSPVRVHTPGGTQTVEWGTEVYLTGSATLLCRGEFFI
jgi:diaminopimelate epimerase